MNILSFYMLQSSVYSFYEKENPVYHYQPQDFDLNVH